MLPPPAPFAVIRRLLDEHGLRIGEVLSLTRSSLEAPSTIHVAGSKGSHARALVDATAYAWIDASTPPGANALCFPFLYRDVASRLEAVGAAYRPAGAENRRVTHAGRARKIQSLHASGMTHAEVAAAIGLKNAHVVPLYLT